VTSANRPSSVNEELRHIGYALTVVIFIGLLVFAACGDLRNKAIDAAFGNCEERVSDADAVGRCVDRELKSEGYVN
jgi:hypothetical protein